MKRILFPFYFFLFTTAANSQHEADNWYFAHNAGISFSTGQPVSVSTSQMNTNEGSSSISDNNGNLLFYSDGVSVWARNHMIMPNGTGLNGSWSSSQSALFIPYPGNDSLYYLFTTPDQYNPGGYFCYSIVDMTLNGGYGDITNKNTQLFTPSTEKVTAVRHANGTDIWVIGHLFGTADFYAYLINPAGINPVPVISSAGTAHSGGISNKIGIMKASPCGDKIALTVFWDAFAELFDFDNSTGIVSNAIHFGNFTPGNIWGLCGTEFSPDGSKLYITQEHPAFLVQYNLLAGSPAAIIASATTIVQFTNTFLGALQNGPDGRMYISRFNTNYPFLDCLNNPDSLGSACNFIATAVVLDTGYCAHGLPNFLSSYFCNLSTGISQAAIANNSVSIFPNPTSDFITIHYNTNSLKEITVSLFNLYGQALTTPLSPKGERSNNSSGEIKIDMRNFPAGIYFVKVRVGENEEVRKVVKY